MITGKEISELYGCGLDKYKNFIEEYLSISDDVYTIEIDYYHIYIYNISLFFTESAKRYEANYYRKVYESLKYCLNVAWIADQLNFNGSEEEDMPEFIYWREMSKLFKPTDYLIREPNIIPLFSPDEDDFLRFCSIPIVFGKTKFSEIFMVMLPSILVPF